jgi:hypothetical protein
MNPRAGMDDVEKRNFLTIPGLELRPLSRPAIPAPNNNDRRTKKYMQKESRHNKYLLTPCIFNCVIDYHYLLTYLLMELSAS